MAIDLDRLEEMEKAATRGPWEARACNSGYACWCRVVFAENDDNPVIPYASVSVENATLIATMRNALPHLLRELRAARAVVEASTGLLNEVGDGDNGPLPTFNEAWYVLHDALVAYRRLRAESEGEK
jgi:hypothetical protein